MKRLEAPIMLVLILSSTFALAQTGTVTERFRAAQEAFDNSQFETTLTLLDAMEKDLGKSPRIESLRALTLRDLNRPRDAYLSLLAYFKLTDGMNLSNSAAHKSLIELRDTLRSQLETDLSAKKDNLQSARNETAQRAISGADTLSKPNTQTSTSVDPLAELEMWNKVKLSTDANDYHLFAMRFPSGSFAKLAKAKMDEIGDPVWNEVKKSKDAFVYRDYIKKNPNSPFVEEAKDKMNIFAATMIAWEQVKDSNSPEALKSYLAKYPNSTYVREAKKTLSNLYYAKALELDKGLSKKSQGIINELTKAIEVDPNNYTLYFFRANVFKHYYDESGGLSPRWKEALKDYTKVLKIKPNIGYVYYYRVGVYLGLHDTEAAMADAMKVIELYPSCTEGYSLRSSVYLGNAYRDKGGSQLAVKDIVTASKLRDCHKDESFAGGVYINGNYPPPSK